MNRTDVIMGPQHGARKTFQNYAESAGRNIEAAGLEPDTIRVGDPKTVIFQVKVSDEVFAASSIRIEAVRETIESSDGHLSLLNCVLIVKNVGCIERCIVLR
jgi:hypothetical protein